MVTLVLIRHGQSLWNAENKFTGWTDIGLSEKGIKEAQDAGKKLEDVEFDVVHTSCLLYTSPSPRDRSLSRMPSSA